MKITKEAIHTDTEALASKMAGLAGAVADAPSDWPEQSKSTEQEVSTNDNGNNDSRVQAWNYVYDLLSHLDPKLTERGSTGREMVVNSIKAAFSEPQEQEWKDGWPPIGKECEKLYDQNKDIYYRVSIIAYDGSSVIYRWHEGDKKGEVAESWCGTNSHGQDIFRPIQSTAERKREELEMKIEAIIAGCMEQNTEGLEGKLIVDYLFDNDMLKDSE